MFEHLSVEDAKSLLESTTVTLVDIRDPDSYHAGHIEGAKHLSSDSLPEFLNQADFDMPLIVYCYHGHSSQPTAEFLAKQGFEKVYSLIGGYTAWQ